MKSHDKVYCFHNFLISLPTEKQKVGPVKQFYFIIRKGPVPQNHALLYKLEQKAEHCLSNHVNHPILKNKQVL